MLPCWVLLYNTDLMRSGLNYNNHSISPTAWMLSLFTAAADEIWLCVCVCMSVSEYMHACACIHLCERVRAGRWHVDAEPTRAVPCACFSVTLHLHQTSILQIPHVTPRGLALTTCDTILSCASTTLMFCFWKGFLKTSGVIWGEKVLSGTWVKWGSRKTEVGSNKKVQWSGIEPKL